MTLRRRGRAPTVEARRKGRAPAVEARRKGRARGAAMMVWLFFANLFDPAKVATTEQVAADSVNRGEAHRRAATAAGRPE